MLLHWRGRGWLVFVAPFAWIFAVVFALIALDFHAATGLQATVATLRFMGLGLGLGAATLWLVFMFRPPAADEFMWLPVRHWTWLVAAVAIGVVGASFFVRA